MSGLRTKSMGIVEASPPSGRFVKAHPRPTYGLFERWCTTEINEAAIGQSGTFKLKSRLFDR